MRVSLSIEEVAAIRNALATRHDDLRDLIQQWSQDRVIAKSEQLADTKRELAVVLAIDEKLAAGPAGSAHGVPDLREE